MGDYRAIIFDLDGVLIDTEPLYLKAGNLLVQQDGALPITDQESKDVLLGTTVEETWRRIIGLRGLVHPLQYYLDRYDNAVRQVLKADMVPQPGVLDLIRESKERELPIGVASSSMRSWIQIKLEAIGLANAFDLLVGGDEVARGKPEPDIYIKAARGLGVPTDECVAIEDSPTGIAAAVASGAYTVAVWTESTDGLDVSHANTFLRSLEQFDLTLLKSAGDQSV